MSENMSRTELETELKRITEAVNSKLEEIARVPDVPEKSVYEAMRYSLLAGGKRLRPVLTAAAALMTGGDFDDAVTAGCALECVHTYSLIHDDLPCMDDDDLRRGKPTCHKVFPENIALLAGDGLLTKAFEIISAPDSFGRLSAETVNKLALCLSRAAGCGGMIGGQVIDLESENMENISAERLTLMHRKKTGAMIEAAALMGALIGGITDENSGEYKAISDYAMNLGLAFQIKDDILDVVGDENVLGKPVGSDEQQGKNTFVTLLGISGAEKRLKKCTADAIGAIEIFGEKGAFLRGLARKLASRDS